MSFITGYVSSCGLTMVLIAVTTLLIFMMFLATMCTPIENRPRPRCRRNPGPATESLLFLVHHENNWKQNQLDALESIAEKYTECAIELTLLNDGNSTLMGNIENSLKENRSWPSTKSKRYIATAVTKKLPTTMKKYSNMDINIGAKKLLQNFLFGRKHLAVPNKTQELTQTLAFNPPTIHNLLKRFPGIIVKNMSTKDFFAKSPLFATWQHLNNKTALFAVRVLKLWEFGGISFELPGDFNDSSSLNFSSLDEDRIVKNLINVGYSSYKTLPEGLVTVDERGLHMETKTTCHAFFGETLATLRSSNATATVYDVIKKTLKVFCAKGAVDWSYCKGIMS